MIVGASKGAAVDLRLTTHFPQRVCAIQERATTILSASVPLQEMSAARCAFEHDWEVVPGMWTFEFWFRTRKVGEQSFCVYRPLQGDEKQSEIEERCSDELIG
jgi:hypothetical protein